MGTRAQSKRNRTDGCSRRAPQEVTNYISFSPHTFAMQHSSSSIEANFSPLAKSPVSVVTSDRICTMNNDIRGNVRNEEPSVFLQLDNSEDIKTATAKAHHHRKGECSVDGQNALQRTASRKRPLQLRRIEKKTNTRKSVRFAPSVIVRRPKKMLVDKDDLVDDGGSLIWWSKEEQLQIRSDIKQCIMNARKCPPDSVKHLLHIYGRCGEDGFSFAESTKSICSSGQEDLVNGDEYDIEAGGCPPSQHTTGWRSDIRGLEYCLDKTFSKNRSIHIRSVVRVQQKRIKNGFDTVTNDVILRRQSLHTSRKARKFARILAHYDAMEVVSMLKEELDATSNRLSPPFSMKHL